MAWHLGNKCEYKNDFAWYKIYVFYSFYICLGSNNIFHIVSKLIIITLSLCNWKEYSISSSHKYIFAILISVPEHSENR